MLSFMTNDQAVGLYSAAYNLIEGLLFVPLAFTTAITPLASQLFYKSLTRMRNVCAESLRYMAMISLPIAVGTTLFASKIINIIYGKQYFGSVLALQVLIWSIVPTFLHYVLGLFVVSTNNEKQGTINTGSCAILNVLLNLVLIPKYSFVGAAVATIITEAFLVVMNYRVLHRVFESFKLVGSIYKPLAASLIMASVAFVPNAGFALTVPLALVLYIGTLWILGGFSRDDIDMIKDVMRVRNEARKRF
jgi:O-antigen/teichoic acid export membrane protein